MFLECNVNEKNNEWKSAVTIGLNYFGLGYYSQKAAPRGVGGEQNTYNLVMDKRATVITFSFVFERT